MTLEQILKLSNPAQTKNVVLFRNNATFNLKYCKKYMGEYKILKVENKEITTNLTEQIYFEVRESE